MTLFEDIEEEPLKQIGVLMAAAIVLQIGLGLLFFWGAALIFRAVFF